jgi:outer membrane receptor protein involved in Fe transport
MTSFRSFARAALVGSVSAVAIAAPGFAQQAAAADEQTGIEEIIVTAQRQAQSLQDVPIAVSAFTADALEKQQINSTSDLQLTLPNVTFQKSNFTGSNFTIRGVGDAAVATSGDSSTGIHVNDMPLTGTRLFETDYFDLERLEVLRGPQGTLYGRNATSGVINFVTAKPDLTGFGARGTVEYGNYESIRADGMVNVPLNDKVGIRVAGTYLKRDGFTKNLFTGNQIDGRDQYALRGTIRLAPTEDTTLDIIGYRFKEDSNRSRIQKQLCHRDPTGILGCQPDELRFETLNGNATLGATLSSPEFFRAAVGGAAQTAGAQAAALAAAGNAAGAAAAAAQATALAGLIPTFGAVGFRSVYAPDGYSGQVNPADLRTVNTDYEPTYRSAETHLMGKLQHDFGTMNLNVTAGYTTTSVRSRTDYNLAVQNSAVGLAGPALLRSGAVPFLAQAAARLYQGTNLCVSAVDTTYTGFINGKRELCAPQGGDYDESGGRGRTYVGEAHIDSQFDGKFNFLLGAIYIDGKTTDSDYFVASSGLDYGTAVIGALQTLGAGGNGATASPFFNSETALYTLKTYGLFGEAYYQASDELKITAGLRYSNDKKFVRDRQLLFNVAVPYGTADVFANTAFVAGFDADAGTAGNQTFREARAKFDEVTGRLVVDWKPTTSFTDDTLVYASYSRGYKSGGINPPFNPLLFSAPATYRPEIINAFEIGTKNTFAGGTFRANLTGFYYDYKDLQISRIINRTSFNDNTNASIYGVEGEFILAPTDNLLFNANASYLKTKVKDLVLVDTRDPSGGRPDTVIIKDLQGGANCVVTSRVGGAAGTAFVNAYVNAVNGGLGLAPTVAVPGTTATGAFGLCSVLASTAAAPSAALRTAFATPTGPLPIVFDAAAAAGSPTLPAGNAVNLDGNQLPNAPKYKFSLGSQYTVDMENGMSAVFRMDYAYTGSFFSRTFNRPIDKVNNYDQINAQIQLNGVDDKWFVRAFVQNLENDDSIVGQYVTDPSSGLFTNVFTLEPRRYGLAAGFNF